jgi:probable rRNA maturation factor
LEPPPVHIESSLRSWKINERRIRSILKFISESLGVGEMTIHVKFVGPGAMRKINRRFREKDKSTDVLSFPQMEWSKPRLVAGSTRKQSRRSSGGRDLRNKDMLRGTRGGLLSFSHENILGDLVLCIDAADSNAREDNSDVAKEVCFLLAHGMLHLCGHDHQNAREKALMFAQQDQIMAELGNRWRRCVERLS